MKILCSYSSIEFTCDHFPGTFYSRETYHPIFNLPQKKLLAYTGKWAAGELTTTDSYLLFLALLNSSELVEFRVPVFRFDDTDSIVAKNMESLIKALARLNTVSSPSLVFPRYAITPDTRFLTNVKYWIENWHREYHEFVDNYQSAHESNKLLTRERALERMIKNPHKKDSEYAHQIAEWACIAGKFPSFLIDSPWTKEKLPLAEYWKQIIIRCTRSEYVYAIPLKDIKELLEHCEENVEPGSIFSYKLFQVLRKAVERQNNFLGLGDMDITKSTYQILEQSDSVEDGNLKAIIDSAPEEEPKPEQYPSKFKFMQAKLRWEMAKKFHKAKEDSGERRNES